MENPVDLSLLGIESTPEPTPEPIPESEPVSEPTPEIIPGSEPEPLEGPEDYSPRERTLLQRIEELTQRQIEAVPDRAEPSAPIMEPVLHNFLEGKDIDDILSDPAALNSLLLSVYNKGLEEASKLAAENIMRTLPQTVSSYVNNHVTMTEIVRDFYDNNPDLKSVRRTVAAVANEIAAASPELSTAELFNRAADKTREILQLKRISPVTNNKRPAPAFARQRGRTVTPELSGLQKEIEDLIQR